MSAVCKTYEEAREALRDSALQFWDGKDWQDVPRDSSVFFARNVEDYRRKPTLGQEVPKFYVYRSANRKGDRLFCFEEAKAVATFLWKVGADLRTDHVFKRVHFTSLDIRRIEEQLENS